MLMMVLKRPNGISIRNNKAKAMYMVRLAQQIAYTMKYGMSNRAITNLYDEER